MKHPYDSLPPIKPAERDYHYPRSTREAWGPQNGPDWIADPEDEKAWPTPPHWLMGVLWLAGLVLTVWLCKGA